MNIYAFYDNRSHCVRSIFAQLSDEFARQMCLQMIDSMDHPEVCRYDDVIAIGQYDILTGHIDYYKDSDGDPVAIFAMSDLLAQKEGEKLAADLSEVE